MTEKPNLHLAIFQSRAEPGRDPGARIDDLDRALAGNREPIDLVVCPELYLSGYGAGERHRLLAEPADGPFAAAIAALAQRHRCCIVYGYPEIDTAGAVYNSAAVFGADGKLLANHRKTVLPNDYERSWFRAGDRFTAFQLGEWRIALTVCYEVEFPEILRACAREGAELIVAPTALTRNWAVVAHQVVPTRAFENGVFLAYANHAGEEHGRDFLGASCIVDPHGTVLARAGEGEQLISAELDPAAIAAARAALPYLDDCRLVAGLAFDEAEAPPLTMVGDG